MKDLRKFMFGEAWFVFVKPGEKPVDQILETPGEMSVPEVEFTEAKVDVAQEAGKDIAKAKTVMELENLQKQLGDGVVDFLTAVNFQGKEIPGMLALKNLNFEKAEQNIAAEFLKFLDGKKLDDFAKTLGVDAKEMNEVVSLIYAKHAVKQLKDATKIDEEFVKANPTMLLNYKVVIDKVGTLKVEIEPKEFVEAHKKFLDSEEAKKKENPKEKEAEKNYQDKLARLQSTPLGKVMAMLGYNKVGTDGKTGFQRIMEGSDFVGVFLLGIFGYTEFVGEGFKGMVEMMPAKYKDKVDEWMKRAESSKFSADSWKKSLEKGDTKVEATAPNVAKVKGADFEKVIQNSKDFSEKVKNGVQLENEFEIKAVDKKESLKVVLEQGGEMTVPKGASLSVNGKIEDFAKSGKVYGVTDKVVTLKGKIPAGVIFKGNIRFEMV